MRGAVLWTFGPVLAARYPDGREEIWVAFPEDGDGEVVVEEIEPGGAVRIRDFLEEAARGIPEDLLPKAAVAHAILRTADGRPDPLPAA